MDRRTFVTMLAALPVVGVVGVACSEAEASGVRVINPDAARATLFDDPPENLVVLDVRTPSEYDAGRLPEAQLLDFYRADFADRLAELDRDVPYLLYCRSGNRSAETRALMQDLGFADVRDIEGGFNAWYDAGHPFVVG